MNTSVLPEQAQIYKLNQFSVPVTNAPGELARLLLTLKYINLSAILADTGNSAQVLVRFVSSEEPLQIKQLLKKNNFGVFVASVFALKIENKSGRLLKVLEWLSENGINISQIYGTTGEQESSSWIIIQTEDASLAEQVLKEKYQF